MGVNNRCKEVVHTHGKAFRISSITASLTAPCMSSEFRSRVAWTSACRSARVFWKCFSDSIPRFSQASYASGNRVLRPKPIKVFKALSSRVSERHNTTSSSLECNSFKESLENNNRKTLTIGDESGKRSDGRKKNALPSPSQAGNGQS